MLLIHYSSENLFEHESGLSPRVTAIVVQHFQTEQTISFAFHEAAEVLGISRADAASRLDDIERAMLDRFDRFVLHHSDKIWVHWNMRSLAYGFELIALRHRALTKREMTVVPIEHRVNLNEVLKDRYGEGYVPDPKLYTLMDLNGGRPHLLLNGAEESAAFRAGEYLKMHNSALAKVAFLSRIVSLIRAKRVRTSSRSWNHLVDRVFASRLGRLLALLGWLAALAAVVVLLAKQ